MNNTDLSKLDLFNKYRFVQFQLWRDCTCNCDFCYNKGLGNSDKIKSLNFIYNKITTDPLINKFNEIGFIGGETFGKQLDNPQVKKLFYKVMNIVVDKLKSGQFNKLYITTSLIYKNTDSLIEFIEFIKSHNLTNKLLICTSYDTIYRFKNKISEDLWKSNVNFLHLKYPELLIHTQIILTNDFITKVIEGKFNILEFQEKYKTVIDYIEPSCNSKCKTVAEFNSELPNFFPTRSNFLKFLKFTTSNNLIDLNRFLNPNLRSDLLYVEYDNKPYEFWGRRKNTDELLKAYCNKMGRTIVYSSYADSAVRLEDDVKAFKDSF